METEKGMTVRLEHEAHTDVMYVDIAESPSGSIIDVIDLSEKFGFPQGQFLVRMDREGTTLLGFTIHRFASFKRTLKWKFQMLSFRKAILLLIDAVIAGILAGAQSRNRARAGACHA